MKINLRIWIFLTIFAVHLDDFKSILDSYPVGVSTCGIFLHFLVQKIVQIFA